MRSFPVVLLPQPEGGYFVQCPTLPGCYSQGGTVEEALQNIREAIEQVLEDMTDRGEPVPQSGPPIATEVTIEQRVKDPHRAGRGSVDSLGLIATRAVKAGKTSFSDSH
ncbi:MAG: type II toxin-antitoxin system HicB family antitoxin [Phycisphaeraceae bacterium]|nr:type II toxin-antitoxin system HicB family antitoxin [Phycisphaeraceae bacterium]